MGCDLHLYTEVKKTINNNEMWVNSDFWSINPYFRYGDEEDKKYERELDIESIYSGRDYELFGILADVRGYGNEVISDPRGLPKDVSDIVKAESDKWGSDGHSHSHLTLKELVEYLEKHPHINESGFVPSVQAKELDENGVEPTMWAEEVSPQLDWEYREWKRTTSVGKLVEKLKQRYSDIFWVRPEKQITEDYEKIRIVFWFDN